MLHTIRNLRIRTKILLVASLIQITILLAGALIYNEIVQNQQRALELLQITRVITAVEALQAQLSIMDISARSYILSGNEVLLAPYRQAYTEQSKLREQIQAQVSSEPEQLARLAEVQRLIETWRTDFLLPGLELRDQSDTSLSATEAKEARLAQLASDAEQAFDQVQARIDLFRTFELDQLERRELAAQQTSESLQLTLLGSVIMLVIGSLGACWLLASNIARRISYVIKAATQMARGDLSARCDLRSRGDEVGLMADTFNTMAQALQEYAGNLEVQYQASETARHDAEQAHAQVVAQLATIERQQSLIRQMSVPVLPLDNTTLVMPLVGTLDGERLRLVQEQALHALEHTGARQLILDVTGIPVVDTEIAGELLSVTQMAALLGAQVCVVGIRPEVAQTLVSLNIDYAHLQTYATLQQGIANTIEQRTLHSSCRPPAPKLMPDNERW